MVTRINYHPNGSAEDSGTYATYWGTSGSGTTNTRTTSEFSHGAASGHMVNTGVDAFNSCSTSVGSAITTDITGEEVWVSFKWKGTGLVRDIFLFSFRDDFGANDNDSATDVTPPADWTVRVMGPVTIQSPAGLLSLSFGNDEHTDGSGAYDIYVDEVMFTNLDPTGWDYFEGELVVGNPYARIRSQFELRPY